MLGCLLGSLDDIGRMKALAYLFGGKMVGMSTV
jgi:hypothetical protein